MEYINQLNSSQRAAVLHTDGDSMIIAGAGSGKTRVLTYKIAYLLQQGYMPDNILALTFTNKAAGEMKSRISSIVGKSSANRIWMGTFHSIFSRILRVESDRLGYSRNYTIYDSADSLSLIKSIIKEMGLDEKRYKPTMVHNRISSAKNRLLTASQYSLSSDYGGSDNSRSLHAIANIYKEYETRCHRADAMDFDDLLLNTFLLFKNNPDVLAYYGGLFRYILVDEYQDTNYAQHTIVWQLTRQGAHLCVVGDDAQSIYAFRGANIQNMLSFQKQYPEYKLFKLEQNYRSTQTIVNAASSLIEKNRSQIKKSIYSENAKGDLIECFSTHSDVEEAAVVVNKLLDLHTFKGVEWNDIAVLYRTNGQSRVLEEALLKSGLPYRIYGGLSFYQRREIKDMLAYFRVIVNPHDDEALKRIINNPKRGIGDTTISKLHATAIARGVSLWSIITMTDGYSGQIGKSTLSKLEAFVLMIKGFMDKSTLLDAHTLAHKVYEESGMQALILQDTSIEGMSRKENVEELMNGIIQFCSDREEEGSNEIFMSHYLSSVSLLTDQDKDDDDTPRVTLMTIHASKGLEFDSIFIVGLEENLFPSEITSENDTEIEEERRLMYVAMTRAKSRLYLLHSSSRFRNGEMQYNTPSRFIGEIDRAYLLDHRQKRMPFNSAFQSRPGNIFNTRGGFVKNNPSRSFERRDERHRFERVERPASAIPLRATSSMQVATDSTIRERTATPLSNQSLKVGAIIEHDRFGIGKVTSLEGFGGDTKARIEFVDMGSKVLLLKFARIKILKE